MGIIDNIITLIRNIARSLRFNGLYIILSILLPILLIKEKLGKDMVMNLIDNGVGWSGRIFPVINLLLINLAFIILSLSIWTVPTLGIYVWRLFLQGVGNKAPAIGYNNIQLQNKLVEAYNKKNGLAIRYFALLPYFLFLMACTFTYYSRFLLLIIVIIILIVFVLYRCFLDNLLNSFCNWLNAKRVTKVHYSPARKAFLAICYLTGFFTGLNVIFFIVGLCIGVYPSYIITLTLLFLLKLHFYMKFMENRLSSVLRSADSTEKVEVQINIQPPPANSSLQRNVQLSWEAATGNNDQQNVVQVIIRPQTSFKLTNALYQVFFSIGVISVVLLICSNRWNIPAGIHNFSPIYVIITLISFILFIVDLLFTAQITITKIQQRAGYSYNYYSGFPVGNLNVAFKLWTKESDPNHQGLSKSKATKYKVFITGIGLLLIVSGFFYSNNSHRIRKEYVQEDYYYSDTVRQELIPYFRDWLQKRGYTNRKTGDTITIYLISGQGGGSRAATWFLLNMYRLEQHASGFHNNVFSISTVSGSSSGAGMYLADRFFGVKQKPPNDTVYLNRIKKMYARNYMSGNFYGLLLGDGIEGIIGMNKEYPKDRNYFLQMEECGAYYNAARDTKGIENKNFVKYADFISQKNRTISEDPFFNSDYLRPYYTNNKLANNDSFKNIDTCYPLFFINTSVMDDGQRAVFSPIKMESFSIALDLYQAFKLHTACGNGRKYYNLPLTTAICQSQAFPLLNSNNYMDCIGRLVDGGLYENGGCTTTFEIYLALRRYCDTFSNCPNVKFIIVNLENNKIDNPTFALFKPASVLNTPSAAINTMFGGHEVYAYKFLNKYVKESNRNDTVYNIVLECDIPTSRILRDRDINTLDSMSKKWFDNNKTLFIAQVKQ